MNKNHLLLLRSQIRHQRSYNSNIFLVDDLLRLSDEDRLEIFEDLARAFSQVTRKNRKSYEPIYPR